MFTTTQVHLSYPFLGDRQVVRPPRKCLVVSLVVFFFLLPFSHERREAWNVGSIAFATVLGSCVVARMLVVCVIFNHERSDDDGPLSRDWGKLFFVFRPPHFSFIRLIWNLNTVLLIVIILFTVYAIIVIKSMVGLLIYLIGGVVSVFSTTPEPPVATGLVIGWFERQLAPPSASAAPGRSARRLVSNRFPAASRPLSGQSWSACH